MGGRGEGGTIMVGRGAEVGEGSSKGMPGIGEQPLTEIRESEEGSVSWFKSTFFMQGFQVRDVLGGAAQDVAGGIRQQVQAHCGNRLPGVGLLEYFDDIAAQSTGAPCPARVH